MTKIIVIGPRDKVSDDIHVVNTTSRSTTASKFLSPFILGPVTLPTGEVALNMENGWQYSKLYYEHLSDDGQPSEAYWQWRDKGFKSKRAERYPMGKGAVPVCSLLGDDKLDYIEARKKIYVPLYAAAVTKHPYWKNFVEWIHTQDTIALWDFDGYKTDQPFRVVLNDRDRKMGHAFVIKALLEGVYSV